MNSVTITDPYVIRLIERERERRGDTTRPKTAGRLIVERLGDLDRKSVDAGQNSVGSAGSEVGKASNAKAREASTAAA